MNDDTFIGLLWIAITFGPMLILWAAIRYTKRRPRNRWVKPAHDPRSSIAQFRRIVERN